jgi:hypothetical protein
LVFTAKCDIIFSGYFQWLEMEIQVKIPREREREREREKERERDAGCIGFPNLATQGGDGVLDQHRVLKVK